jgi:hypothetical protein
MSELPVYVPVQNDGLCRNCGAPGVRKFCANCGQESADRVPTLREWLAEVRDEYWILDGKLVRSFAHLVARPGLLTFEWIGGRRQQYIRPFRLFLIALPAMFIGSGFTGAARWILIPASVLVLAAASFLAEGHRRRRASVVPHFVLSFHSHALLLITVPIASGLLEVGERLALPATGAVLFLFPLAVVTHLAGAYNRWLDKRLIHALLRAAFVLLAYIVTFAAIGGAGMALGAIERNL